MADGVQILIVICLLLTTAICCWRFYLRLVISRQYLAIELALLAALICYITMGAMQIQMIKLLGTASSPQDGVVINKYFFSGTFFYLATLWSVKISVNLLVMRLTFKFVELHVWAVRSLWFLILSLPVMYAVYLVACLPIHRHWDAPLGIVEACPPIMRSWDFWTHFSVNLLTDVWLCALPLTALLQIQEKRLRIAVCGVYGLALVTVIVSIVRATLLGINAQANVKYIVALTIVELSTAIIIASLPGISSGFTKKYVYGSDGSRNKSTRDWSRKTGTFQQQQSWKALGRGHELNEFSGSTDHVELRDGTQLSLRPASTKGYTTEDDAGSADRIEKGVHVAVTMV